MVCIELPTYSLIQFPELGLLCDRLFIFAKLTQQSCLDSSLLFKPAATTAHSGFVVPGVEADAGAPFKLKLFMFGDRLELNDF